MKTEKFKLIDNGNNGVEVWGKEYRPSPKNPRIICVDPVSRKRRLPFSDDMYEKLGRLKYFFLNLTGHWVPPYSKYFNLNTLTPELVPEGEEPAKGFLLMRSLLNRTRVTGVTLTEMGFVMTGIIEVVGDKVIGLSTPHITEDDDVGFYGSATDEIYKVFDMIDKFVDAPVLTEAAARKMLAEHGIKEEELSQKSEEDMICDAAELLASKNFVILSEADTSHMITGKKEEKKPEVIKTDSGKVSTSRKNIDEPNIPESEANAINENPGYDENLSEDLMNKEFSENMPATEEGG